jgi:hypothetical protein
MYHHRLAMQQCQHTLLGARAHARAATDALRQINFGMLKTGGVAAALSGGEQFAVTSGRVTKLRPPARQDQDSQPEQQRRRCGEEPPV